MMAPVTARPRLEIELYVCVGRIRNHLERRPAEVGVQEDTRGVDHGSEKRSLDGLSELVDLVSTSCGNGRSGRIDPQRRRQCALESTGERVDRRRVPFHSHDRTWATGSELAVGP